MMMFKHPPEVAILDLFVIRSRGVAVMQYGRVAATLRYFHGLTYQFSFFIYLNVWMNERMNE